MKKNMNFVVRDSVLAKFRVLPAATLILFMLVLWKFSGIRLWPHIYAGQSYQPTRLVYYLEFFTTLVSIGMAILHINAIKEYAFNNKLIILYIAYAFAVVLIAGNKNITTLQLLFGYFEAFVSLVLVLVYFGYSNLRRWLAYFGIGFILINCISVLLPSISLMYGSFNGFFRGLTAHRNDLSHITVISLYFIICMTENECKNYVKLPLIFLGLLLVALAGSVQGILLTIVGALIFYSHASLRFFKHPFTIATVIFGFITASIFFAGYTLDEFLGYFGRDTTFTGRDRIWAMSEYMLSNMPWYGYGIGSMGSNSPFISASILHSFKLGTAFGTAHNSYLEAFLSFGWLGGVLFLTLITVSAIKILSAFLRVDNSNATLPMMILVFCLLGGITSTEKLFYPSFGWFSFLIAVLLNQSCSVKSR